MSTHRTGRRRHICRLETGIRSAAELRASLLDREADHELKLGHHVAAERLSWRAVEIREQVS